MNNKVFVWLTHYSILIFSCLKWAVVPLPWYRFSISSIIYTNLLSSSSYGKVFWVGIKSSSVVVVSSIICDYCLNLNYFENVKQTTHHSEAASRSFRPQSQTERLPSNLRPNASSRSQVLASHRWQEIDGAWLWREDRLKHQTHSRTKDGDRVGSRSLRGPQTPKLRHQYWNRQIAKVSVRQTTWNLKT